MVHAALTLVLLGGPVDDVYLEKRLGELTKGYEEQANRQSAAAIRARRAILREIGHLPYSDQVRPARRAIARPRDLRGPQLLDACRRGPRTRRVGHAGRARRAVSRPVRQERSGSAIRVDPYGSPRCVVARSTAGRLRVDFQGDPRARLAPRQVAGHHRLRPAAPHDGRVDAGRNRARRRTRARTRNHAACQVPVSRVCVVPRSVPWVGSVSAARSGARRRGTKILASVASRRRPRHSRSAISMCC